MTEANLDRRVLRTKRNIRNAFLYLLKQKTPSQMTVKELSELADINRKTFYIYYSSIDGILNEIEQELLAKINLLFEDLIPKIKAGMTVSPFHDLNRIIMEDLELYRLLNHAGCLPAFTNKAKDALITIMFQEYQLTDSPENERYILYAEYTAAGILSMYSRWFSQNFHISLDEFTEIAGEIIMNGYHQLLPV